MVQVKNAAIKALTSASAAMGNKDIEKLVPAVISAMANPTQVYFAFRSPPSEFGGKCPIEDARLTRETECNPLPISQSLVCYAAQPTFRAKPFPS